jgi:hypothetical protein
MRVNEALQHGMKSQQVHRALSANGDKWTRNGGIETAGSVRANLPRKLIGFMVLFTILLKIIGLFAF